jgi:hypothetical protein
MRFGRRFTDLAEFSEPVVSQIKTDIANGLISVIQFSKPEYTTGILAHIDDMARGCGDRLQIRFYGHYDSVFDARVLKTLPNIRNLALDSLTHIENLHEVFALQNLETLAFGVYHFDDVNFLEKLPLTRMKRLTLMENKKRNFDLRPLESAFNLQELFVEGHGKNIETLSQLNSLNQLVLRSCNARIPLAFINEMVRLTSLQLILGGRSDIREIESEVLETLEIVQVKGLNTLDELGRFKKLTALRLEDQLQLESLDVSDLKLRRLTISNCKRLSTLLGMDQQQALEELFVAKTQLPIEGLFEGPWPKTMRCLGLFGPSAKWNKSMAERSKQRGYSVYGSGWI